MNKEFTESEWSKMSCMVNAIWGVDIDTVKLLETKSTADKIIFPVLRQRGLHTISPIFDKGLVELDRWLIPWQVKAGYSAQLNMLVYRVAQ